MRSISNPLRKVPGPWHSRFTRLPLKIAILTGRRAYYIHSLHERFGPFVRIGPDEIAVNDPETFAQIHKIGTRFLKTDWYEKFTEGSDRLSLFTMVSPKEHAMRRRMFSRPFSKGFLLEHWHDTVKEMSQFAVRRMRDTALAGNGTLDIMEWWTFLTMDVSGKLMYGHSFENLERGTVGSMYSPAGLQDRMLTRSALDVRFNASHHRESED